MQQTTSAVADYLKGFKWGETTTVLGHRITCEGFRDDGLRIFEVVDAADGTYYGDDNILEEVLDILTGKTVHPSRQTDGEVDEQNRLEKAYYMSGFDEEEEAATQDALVESLERVAADLERPANYWTPTALLWEPSMQDVEEAFKKSQQEKGGRA